MPAENFYAVIMAGGGGTRLWPLSRQERPKQMISIQGGESLFQMAVRRLEGLFPPDRIVVVTTSQQAALLQPQAPAIPSENYLLEPLPRGTASAIGLAAVALHARNPQAVMAVLTADHYMANEALFRELLVAAGQAAEANYLVTLGITPTQPATGYGYIHNAEAVGAFGGHTAYRVLRFREKPDATQAAAMLAEGSHTWNSGMFIWKTENILAEFARQMPDLSARLSSLAEVWNTPERDARLAEVWPGIQSETIDYGIMEGAQRVIVIPAGGLGWNDVGSWDSLFDILPADTAGNVVQTGLHLEVATQNTLIYAPAGQRLIVTLGVQDLVVVDTGDVLLVCHKDYAQHIRDAVTEVRKTYPEYI